MNWPKIFDVQFTVGVATGKLHPSPTPIEKSAGRGFSGLLFSHSVISNSLQPHRLQHSRLPCPSPTPGAYSYSCSLSWWCHPTISSFVIPFSSHLQSFPALGSPKMGENGSFHQGLSQHQGLFIRVSSHQLAKGLDFQFQHQSFQWTFRTDFLQDGLVGCPCSTKDSQESSQTPQFKNINSLALRFLYSPTLTSIHDYWKNHGLD